MSLPISVLKDEYLADLYHFATKEDTYANYFIHVSPRVGSSQWNSGADTRHHGHTLQEMGGRGVFLRTRGWGGGGRGEGSASSLTHPGVAPLSPQLMEIQADYHRKSLSSLDAALAELRENHSQAGGDRGGAGPCTPAPSPAWGLLRCLHAIPGGSRDPWMSSEQNCSDSICD